MLQENHLPGGELLDLGAAGAQGEDAMGEGKVQVEANGIIVGRGVAAVAVGVEPRDLLDLRRVQPVPLHCALPPGGNGVAIEVRRLRQCRLSCKEDQAVI